jgi:hypothetical protein
VPAPIPVPDPVSILPVALACAAILQVLITLLGLCADTIRGFEPDSRCQPSTRSFSTVGLASLPDLPHVAVHVASSTVAAGVLLMAAGADTAGASSTVAAGVLLALWYGRVVGLDSVRARWAF